MDKPCFESGDAGSYLRSVTLWHGTTKSAAERIVDQGFVPVGTAAIVGAIARDHGLAGADLLTTLRTAGRFVAIQDRRDDAVWFATSRAKANRWAQRAPEVRWEALWAVWWLNHGGYELIPCPWLDLDASGWHARQFFADPPAIIEVKVPINRVQDRYQKPLLSDALADVMKYFPELSVAHTIPVEWIVSYEIMPREVEFTAAAGILGLEISELTHRVNSGEIIPCRPPNAKYGSDSYWYLDEFLTLLPDPGCL
jgi:hypothetical protein